MSVTIRLLRNALPRRLGERAKFVGYVHRAFDMRMENIRAAVDAQGLLQGPMDGGTAVIRWASAFIVFSSLFLTALVALAFILLQPAPKTTSPLGSSCLPGNTPPSLMCSQTPNRRISSPRTIGRAWDGRTRAWIVILGDLSPGLLVGTQSRWDSCCFLGKKSFFFHFYMFL